MSTDDHSAFLGSVRVYVEAHPDVAPYVTQYVSDGLTVALGKANERAADMEVALAAALNKRLDPNLVRQKLDKWKGQTSLNWEIKP